MLRSLVASVFCISIFTACTPSYQKYLVNYRFTSSGQPDYSSLVYWAAHPNKKDPSDSIPAPLANKYFLDSTVDVFFIHPTTFTDRKDERWNADINDATLNAKTDYSTILYQASAFNEALVYAPRYRQANIKAYFTNDTVDAQKALNLAYEDVRSAFQYYLDHFNHGHPIIIAAHSQGSSHAIRLLREFFDGKPLQQRLVVAYVAGMNIPLNAFTQLEPCRDSMQTGCFCGWRTFKNGYEPNLIVKYQESYVTNPLNWQTNDAYAGYDLNKGAVLIKFNKLYPRVTDAQIHNNILWVNRPKFPGGFLYRLNNYHVADINLFYINIRRNVRTRIEAFRKKISIH